MTFIPLLFYYQADLTIIKINQHTQWLRCDEHNNNNNKVYTIN